MSACWRLPPKIRDRLRHPLGSETISLRSPVEFLPRLVSSGTIQGDRPNPMPPRLVNLSRGSIGWQAMRKSRRERGRRPGGGFSDVDRPAQLRGQLGEAMKARDTVRLGFLRYWIAQLTLGSGAEMSDADAMKKMRGVLKEAKSGQTTFSPQEIALIQDWLPPRSRPSRSPRHVPLSPTRSRRHQGGDGHGDRDESLGGPARRQRRCEGRDRNPSPVTRRDAPDGLEDVPYADSTAMSIPFVCEHCGHPIDVDDRLAGTHGQCKHCQQPLVVPARGHAQGPSHDVGEDASGPSLGLRPLEGEEPPRSRRTPPCVALSPEDSSRGSGTAAQARGGLRPRFGSDAPRDPASGRTPAAPVPLTTTRCSIPTTSPSHTRPPARRRSGGCCRPSLPVSSLDSSGCSATGSMLSRSSSW